MERDRREASSISVGVACGENLLIDVWALSHETQGTFDKGDAHPYKNFISNERVTGIVGTSVLKIKDRGDYGQVKKYFGETKELEGQKKVKKVEIYAISWSGDRNLFKELGLATPPTIHPNSAEK